MNRKQNRKSGINLLVILLSAVFCLAVLGACLLYTSDAADEL